MTARTEKRGFATRPADPGGWIKAGDTAPACGAAAVYSARLTIDVTPAMRGRIKVAAFSRGMTVADMVRDLLAREFPPTEGDPPGPASRLPACAAARCRPPTQRMI